MTTRTASTTYLHALLLAMLLAFLLGVIGPARDMLRGMQQLDAGTTATSDTYKMEAN